MTIRQGDAFTLIEIMIVLFISALLIAFGMPEFGKTMRRSRATSAMYNISIMHSANSLYRAHHGQNMTAADIDTINSTLGSHIIADGVTYSCASGTCQAVGTGFSVTSVLADPLATASNPSCSGASCP
ncbi:MAG: prepilin-type N-terminal cleavage/methylation domain-containing protein [Candidatus Omnitrophota bacterium]